MARKDIGQMKRAAGFQSSFWNMFVDALIELGGSSDELYGADEEGLREAAQAAARALSGTTRAGSVVASYELTVNHRRSVRNMIGAGSFTFVNPLITDAEFPHAREGIESVIIDLVQFPVIASHSARMHQLAAHGEPAEMDDLLALALRRIDLKGAYTIFFLGAESTGAYGEPWVGWLCGDAVRHECNLICCGRGARWDPGCVFAVRRPVSHSK